MKDDLGNRAGSGRLNLHVTAETTRVVDESLRFRTVMACVMAIPPKLRESVLFGHHRLTTPLQSVLARLMGCTGTVQFEMLGRLRCRFEAHSSEKYFYLRENFEKETQEFIAAKVTPGMLVFDVGGHIGFMALLFAALGAHVFCFEPSPVSFPRLKRNLALNPDKPVTAINAAASDANGRALLTACGSMSAISSNGSLPIQLVRLDDIAAQRGMPGFLKIDVEGHAAPALRGAKTILCHRPEMMLELHSNDEEAAVMAELAESYRLTNLDADTRYPKRIAAVPLVKVLARHA